MFANLSKRFACIMERCSAEEYLVLARVLPEVVAIEKRVDGWVELIKKDEFKERDCAMDLSK